MVVQCSPEEAHAAQAKLCSLTRLLPTLEASASPSLLRRDRAQVAPDLKVDAWKRSRSVLRHHVPMRLGRRPLHVAQPAWLRLHPRSCRLRDLGTVLPTVRFANSVCVGALQLSKETQVTLTALSFSSHALDGDYV